MKKKPHDRILRDELKQQYLSIVPKSSLLIYKSKDLILESMKLYHVAHSLKFSLFSFLLQQSLHLY